MAPPTDPKKLIAPERRSALPPEPDTDIRQRRQTPASSGGGFDYRSFEGDLDHMVADQAERAAQRRGDAPRDDDEVQSRPTIDLRSMPQDDATFDLRELGAFTILTIRGRITEAFPGQRIASQLRGRVLFDLTEVDRVTSFGVRSWLQMLDEASIVEAYIVRASPAIVHQLTMIRSFCGTARLVSVLAPYACAYCGAEFAVTYSAVDDRMALMSRKPYRVACPDCSQPVEMDEDPWVYFGLDDQLVEKVTPEVQRVLDNVGTTPRHDPIEKSVAGSTTRVRFNGRVSGTSRFQRAFTGLEGSVVIDLRTAGEVAPDGVEALVARLRRLPAEVDQIVIEGAPPPLLKALLGAKLPRVRVQSAATTAVSQTRGIRRKVVVDLQRDGDVLKEGRVPYLDLPWEGEPVALEDLELLARAARELRAAPVRRKPVRAPAEAPEREAFPIRLLAFTMVGTGIIVLGIGVVLLALPRLFAGATPPPPEPTATAAPVEVGTWSTGSPLPPGWVESPVVEQDGSLFVVGRATGATPDEAASLARREAAARLMQTVARRIAGDVRIEPPPAPGDVGWAEAVDRWDRNTRDLLQLIRADDAARKVDEGYEVVARYSVPSDTVAAFVARESRVASFKGITVAGSPPWSEPGLQLVEAASYVRSVKVGDRLLRVGEDPVLTIEKFKALTVDGWHDLGPGDMINLVFEHDGAEAVTTVMKPKATPALRSDPNRPELFETPR